MTVILPGGNEVTVRWRYKNDIPTFTSSGEVIGRTESTTCIVEYKDPTRDGISSGLTRRTCTIKRYHLDKVNLDFARQETLRRVLNDMYPLQKANLFEDSNETLRRKLQAEIKLVNKPNKTLRGFFWDKYRNTFLPKKELSATPL